MKKRLLGIFMSGFLMLSVGTTVVFADDREQSSETDLRAVAIIEISDSETGEIQTYEESLPISITQSGKARGTENIYSVKAEVDLGNCIQQRANDASKTEGYDGVKITAAMDYQNSGIKYKATRMYGNIEFPSDIYYAERRHWNGRDTTIITEPDCCSKGICPTANSWSYKTGCTKYDYLDSSIPPFVRYSARIRVKGMSAYRDINVTCKLDFT